LQKNQQVAALQKSVEELKQAERRTESSYKEWKPGFSVPLLIFIVLVALEISSAGALGVVSEGLVYIVFGSSLVVAYFIPPCVINWIRHRNQVTLPKQQMEIKIKAKEREIEPLKKKVEEEYREAKARLDQELRELESLLEKCRQRQYV
jgi:hypothetical protein